MRIEGRAPHALHTQRSVWVALRRSSRYRDSTRFGGRLVHPHLPEGLAGTNALPPRQGSIGSGWGTRVGSRSVRGRRCPTVTTRPNTNGRCARNGPKERAWASSFRAGSSQSRTESWFNFGNKIVVLDRMDRKPKFWHRQKWLQAYDRMAVARLLPGT